MVVAADRAVGVSPADVAAGQDAEARQARLASLESARRVLVRWRSLPRLARAGN